MATPVPCRHCGYNFMKDINDTEGLCNNCILAQERRNPTKGEKPMDTINITFKCPKDVYAKFEEFCLREGKDISVFLTELVLAQMGVKNTAVEALPKEEPQPQHKKAKK